MTQKRVPDGPIESGVRYDNIENDISGNVPRIDGMVSDGNTMIIIESGLTPNMYQLSFGDMWDLSTLSYDGVKKDVSNELYGGGETMATNGEKLIAGGGGSVYEYSMDAWDLSTLTYNGNSVDLGDDRGRVITSDGQTLLGANQNDDEIYQYNFGSPWDLSTLEYSGEMAGISDFYTLEGILSDGDELLAIGDVENLGQTHRVAQFNFIEKWDVSTLYDSGLRMAWTGPTDPNDPKQAIVSNGRTMIVGTQGGVMYSYSKGQKLGLVDSR